MGTFFALVISGQRGGATLSSNLALMIPGLAAAASAIGSLLRGLVGVIFRHERSVITFVAIAIGAFVTVMVVGEFAVPH